MPEETLSERELEILQLVAAGLSNKEIAARLFLSINTVKVHLRNIFGKIGVQSRLDATTYAIAQGWVIVPGAAASLAPLPEDEPEALEAAPEPQAAAPESVAPMPAAELPPLPWFKRIALASIILLAIAGVAVTWPHPASVGSSRAAGVVEQAPGGGAVNISAADESRWLVRAQLPTPRGRLALAALNGKLYAIGGFTLTGATGVVEIYDPQKNVWSAGASKPLPLGNIAAAVLDQRIYVPGGCNASGAPTNKVEIYDPQQDAWSSAAAPLPAPLCAYALAEYRQKLYLFGGTNGQGYLAGSYVYDPQTGRWSPIAPMPTARGFAAAAVVNDAIYVVSGYDGRNDLAVCERYRPATNQWQPCAPLAVGRGGLGLAALADKLYAIGGGWNSYLAFGERYAASRNSWNVIDTPLIGQWRNLAVAAIGSDIYAVGGWDGQNYLAVNLVYNPFPVKIFVPEIFGGN